MPTTLIDAGSIVLVDVPFTRGNGSKIRPVVVMSRDTPHSNSYFTVVPLTTKGREYRADQLVIDPKESPNSGLDKRSSMKCNQVTTIAEKDVIRVLGTLSESVLCRAKAVLRYALGL